MAGSTTNGRGRNAPRGLWTGSISFGLVNVPVRVFTAVREHTLSFHLVHEMDARPQMYFADEVDAPEQILPDQLPNVAKRELEMGISLIQSSAGIKEERAGREVHGAPEPEDDAPLDLMEALRRGLEQAEGGRARRNDKRSETSSRSPAARRCRRTSSPRPSPRPNNLQP